MSDRSPLLCQADQSVLIVIDIQTRLAQAMPEGSLDRVKRNTERLLRGADLLSVPVLVTEQYPQGIGPTIDSLRPCLPATAQMVEKTCFSACGNDEFANLLSVTDRRQAVLVGMEAMSASCRPPSNCIGPATRCSWPRTPSVRASRSTSMPP